MGEGASTGSGSSSTGSGSGSGRLPEAFFFCLPESFSLSFSGSPPTLKTQPQLPHFPLDPARRLSR